MTACCKNRRQVHKSTSQTPRHAARHDPSSNKQQSTATHDVTSAIAFIVVMAEPVASSSTRGHRTAGSSTCQSNWTVKNAPSGNGARASEAARIDAPCDGGDQHDHVTDRKLNVRRLPSSPRARPTARRPAKRPRQAIDGGDRCREQNGTDCQGDDGLMRDQRCLIALEVCNARYCTRVVAADAKKACKQQQRQIRANYGAMGRHTGSSGKWKQQRESSAQRQNDSASVETRPHRARRTAFPAQTAAVRSAVQWLTPSGADSTCR